MQGPRRIESALESQVFNINVRTSYAPEPSPSFRSSFRLQLVEFITGHLETREFTFARWPLQAVDRHHLVHL